VIADGEVWPGREVLVRRRRNDLGRPRLGISAPRPFGRAVRRNRFRRLVREAFRHRQDRLGPFDYFVSPRRHLVRPTLEGIGRDLDGALAPGPARPSARRPATEA
jgi:ribonuclease P protein component